VNVDTLRIHIEMHERFAVCVVSGEVRTNADRELSNQSKE